MPPGTAKKKDNYFNVEGKKGRKFFFVFAWVFFRDQIIGNWDKLIVSYQCCGCCSSHPFRYVLRFTMLRTARDHQKKKKVEKKIRSTFVEGVVPWSRGTFLRDSTPFSSPPSATPCAAEIIELSYSHYVQPFRFSYVVRPPSSDYTRLGAGAGVMSSKTCYLYRLSCTPDTSYNLRVVIRGNLNDFNATTSLSMR